MDSLGQSSPAASTASGGDKVPASSTKDRRFKLNRACDRCRRRRIKCDEGSPCQACQSSHSTCTFDDLGKKLPSTKSKKTQTLELRLRQLETLVDAIPPAVFAAIGTGSHADSDPSADAGADKSADGGGADDIPPLGPQNGPTLMPLPPAARDTPLTNPSAHFGCPSGTVPVQCSKPAASKADPVAELTEGAARLRLRFAGAPPSLFFVDARGYTRWHGESSGLPLLDYLMDKHSVRPAQDAPPAAGSASSGSSDVSSEGSPPGIPLIGPEDAPVADPDYGAPEAMWAMITKIIPAELMDDLVRNFLCTSYYLLPFLHLPTFLCDYSNPQQWADRGFAAFIVAVCCISTLNIDHPMAPSQETRLAWFELLLRIRSLPGGDVPTPYLIQAVALGAIFAVGQNAQARALALLAEAVALVFEAGLHRRADAYDWFDGVQAAVRARTFWAVYLWDKQAVAMFGRPPLLRLRDCDVPLPMPIDDEFIAPAGPGVQPPGMPSRMAAFASLCELAVVAEAVLDTPPSRLLTDAPGAFLARATAALGAQPPGCPLGAAEALLEDVVARIPPHWRYSEETLASGDAVRIMQAERLHCLGTLLELLIHRHRFSVCVVAREHDAPAGAQAWPGPQRIIHEVNAVHGMFKSASKVVCVQMSIAQRGNLTYHGIDMVHQIIQCARSFVAIALETRGDPELGELYPQVLERLRAVFMLLRHYSGRYRAGGRSCDMMEDMCRVVGIPLDVPAHMSRRSRPGPEGGDRIKWASHIRKRPGAPPSDDVWAGDVTFRSGLRAHVPDALAGAAAEYAAYASSAAPPGEYSEGAPAALGEYETAASESGVYAAGIPAIPDVFDILNPRPMTELGDLSGIGFPESIYADAF